MERFRHLANGVFMNSILGLDQQVFIRVLGVVELEECPDFEILTAVRGLRRESVSGFKLVFAWSGLGLAMRERSLTVWNLRNLNLMERRLKP